MVASAVVAPVVPRYYHDDMSGVVKKSVSVPTELWAAAEEEAATRGMTVSALIAEALDHLVRLQRGLRAVAEYEAENGALTEEELAWADAVLDEQGIGRTL
jgi:predicted nucleic acid-binding protein